MLSTTSIFYSVNRLTQHISVNIPFLYTQHFSTYSCSARDVYTNVLEIHFNKNIMLKFLKVCRYEV